jgi:GDPmannose 4,6-dehydratase
VRALIFGSSGQDGFYLKQLLIERECKVVGVSRSEGDHKRGDVSDFQFVSTLIKELQPGYIFHLAANSTTRHDSLFENHDAISTGTLNILESVYRFSKHSRVFISGSALQFLNKGVPIIETDPFEARDPYSVARIQSVYAARYFRRLGVSVYIGYFFNHDSPLRSERHVNQKIVLCAKRISLGSNEILELGNIDVKKEFTFAGDTVKAVWELVNNSEFFEAVIGSGKAHSIREWLDICFDHFGLDWHQYVKLRDNYLPDYDVLVSRPDTIKSLGWNPDLDIFRLAKMFCSNLIANEKA